MNHVRTKRRSSLKGTTVSNLMRIRMNGPDIDRFDAAKYAREWLRDDHMRSDDPSQVRRTRKEKKNFRQLYDEEIRERDGTVVNGKEMTSSNLY